MVVEEMKCPKCKTKMVSEKKTVGGGMGAKPFKYTEYTCPKCKFIVHDCSDAEIDNINDDDVYEIGG
jgi:ssDNA-binding Zn-finger/Zn-ribbon topoisomerase 1